MADTNDDNNKKVNEAFRRLQNLRARGVLNDRLTESATSKEPSGSPTGQAPHNVNSNRNYSNRNSNNSNQGSASYTAPKTRAPPQTQTRSRNNPGTNGARGWTRTTAGMVGYLWSDVSQGAVLIWRLLKAAVEIVFRAVWWLLSIVLSAARAFFLSWPVTMLLRVVFVCICLAAMVLGVYEYCLWTSRSLMDAVWEWFSDAPGWFATAWQRWAVAAMPTWIAFRAGLPITASSPAPTGVISGPLSNFTAPVPFAAKGLAPGFGDFEKCMQYLSSIPIGEVRSEGVPAKSVNIVWEVLLDEMGQNQQHHHHHHHHHHHPDAYTGHSGAIVWSGLWDEIDPAFSLIKNQDALVQATERQHETEPAQAERLLKDMRQRQAEDETVKAPRGVWGWMLMVLGATDDGNEIKKRLTRARLDDFANMVDKAQASRRSIYNTMREIPDTSMKGVKENVCKMKMRFLQASGRGDQWSEGQLATLGTGNVQDSVSSGSVGGIGGAAISWPAQTTRVLRTWHRASSSACDGAFAAMGDMVSRVSVLEDQLRRLSKYPSSVSHLGNELELGIRGLEISRRT